jgi:predicted TIM-barrel fold metal-dependent hydrolase
MTTALLEQTTRDAVWSGSIIDADVHANVPDIQALFPYLSELWVDWIRERNWRGPGVAASHYPPNSERAARKEWRPEGKAPASSVDLLQTHILDPWRVDAAIVNCYYGVDGLRHPDWAAALAGAVNDYVIDNYLSKDSRLRGSITIPARDPQAMIDEIRRVGDHPGFVQVLFPVRNDSPWGLRAWTKVFEEVAKHDLVVGLHYGGSTEGPPSSTGYATYAAESYGGEWQAFATQLTSLIIEGTFKSVPDLRVSVLEGGWTWAPVWGWRMNKEWKGLRRETPWVDRYPSEIMRDHFRFSTAPSELGPTAISEHIVEWLNTDKLLMFATDYPHRHDDDITQLLGMLSADAQRNLMSETAREWYRL